MKKNIISLGLLMVYLVTFLLLFMKLRNMSAAVQEELTEKNIYYIIGIMFVAGISASFYLIIDANNNRYKLAVEKEDEVISFEETEKNTEEEQQSENSGQNLEKVKSSILSITNQQSNSEKEKIDKVIWKLCDHFEISQALLYTKTTEKGKFDLIASYAFIVPENEIKSIVSGEGLAGQAVLDAAPYFIKDIPEGYLKVISGLGESLPKTLLIIPCVHEKEVQAVFELSSLQEYSKSKFEEIVSICNYITTLLTK